MYIKRNLLLYYCEIIKKYTIVYTFVQCDIIFVYHYKCNID